MFYLSALFPPYQCRKHGDRHGHSGFFCYKLNLFPADRQSFSLNPFRTLPRWQNNR